MADTTLFDTMAPSEGSVANAHERLIRLNLGGAWVNITGDVNNLALNPTPVTTQREVYGTKGANSTNVMNHNFAPSFNVEVVRDPVTKRIVAAQAWVLDLVNAAFSKGQLNKRRFQIFTDALDERMPVFEGLFSVSYSEANTGFADKGVLTFTLANDGDVEQILSPIAGGGEPVLESASPAGQAAGDLIVVRGYGLAGAVSATIDGIAVVEMRQVDDYSLVLLIPSGVAGASPIVVTNAVGPSAPITYNAVA